VDENYLPVVVGVAVVGDRVLRLLFTVDQEAGTLVWPDGIDLAPEPPYEQAKAHPLLAA
jgi:hypothetical protein